MLVKRLVGHFDKVSRTEWGHESAAFLLSTVQNGGSEDVRENLKTCTFETETYGMAKLRARFLLATTKNTRFFG